ARFLIPRLWVQVAFVPVLAIVALALGESYIRVSYFGLQGLDLTRYRPADPSHPIVGAQTESNSITGFKPGTEGHFWGHSFRVNADGFRGKTYPIAKAPGVYRIVVVGASF